MIYLEPEIIVQLCLGILAGYMVWVQYDISTLTDENVLILEENLRTNEENELILEQMKQVYEDIENSKAELEDSKAELEDSKAELARMTANLEYKETKVADIEAHTTELIQMLIDMCPDCKTSKYSCVHADMPPLTSPYGKFIHS